MSDAYATFDNSGLDRKLSAVGEFGEYLSHSSIASAWNPITTA